MSWLTLNSNPIILMKDIGKDSSIYLFLCYTGTSQVLLSIRPSFSEFVWRWISIFHFYLLLCFWIFRFLLDFVEISALRCPIWLWMYCVKDKEICLPIFIIDVLLDAPLSFPTLVQKESTLTRSSVISAFDVLRLVTAVQRYLIVSVCVISVHVFDVSLCLILCAASFTEQKIEFVECWYCFDHTSIFC